MYFAPIWEVLKREWQVARRYSGRANSVRRRRPQRRSPLHLEQLEARLVLTAWTEIGPSPILNGQIAGSGPVSGRVTGLAADPNNADIVYVATAGGGIWKTTNATAATPNWTPLTDNLTDGSGNPLPELMGAVALIDATSGAHSGNQIVYAGMGEANNSGDSFYGDGVLVSTDGGATWTLTNAGGAFTGRTVSKIVLDPSDSTGATAYAAVCGFAANGSTGNTGIWKTTDFGAHWTNTTAAAGLSTFNPWSDVVIDPNAPNVLYAAEGHPSGASADGVYKSTNGGATWSLLNGTGTFNGTQDGRITLAVYNDGTTSELFVSIEDPSSGGLHKMLKSTNGGASFTDLTANVLAASDYLNPQGWYDTTLAIDPQNPNYIYAAGVMSKQGPTFGGSPLESLDGGLTWHDIGTDPAGKGLHTDAHAVAFDANGNVIDGDDGGVFRLSNTNGSLANQRWVDLNSNLATIQFSGIAVDPVNGNVYGGSQDNGTEKYTGGLGWNRILAGDGGIVRIDPTNHNTVYTEQADGNLYVSLNGGTSFTYITPNLLGTNVNFYGPYQVDSKGNLYYGTNVLNLSSNHGSSFSAIGTSGTNGFNSGNATIDAVAVSQTNNNVVYVSVGGHIFISQNAQAGASVSWAQHDVPGTVGSPNGIVVDPSDATGGTAYAVVNAFGSQRVFKTTNFGVNWNNITGDLPNSPVWSVTVSPNGSTVYVGTDVGVYSTSNGGTNWTRLGTGLPNAQVVELDYVASLNILAVGTHGRGAWEISTATAAPGLTVTTPTITAGVAYSKTSSPTIAGTVTDNSGTGIASVTVSIDGNQPVAATLVAGSWTFNASGLADGSHTVAVVATDNANNTSNANFTLKVDTVVPTVAVTNPTITGGIGYSKTGSPTISGTVGDANPSSGIASVLLTIDGNAPVAATVTAGTWSYSASGLADGSHTVSVVATDNAGNSSTAANFTLKVDTVVPTVAVTSPTITAGVAYSKTAAPTISGTVGDANPSSGIASVLLAIDGNAPVAATVTAGTWSYSASGLADGSHTVSVVATDNAGNNSTAANFTLKVDTVAPTVAVTSPTITAGVAYSKTAAPTISGTVGDANPSSGIASVMLTIDGNAPVAATVTAGTWSYSASGLADGSHTVSVVATDNAGNSSTAANFTLKVDTVVPTVAVTAPTITAGVAYSKTAAPTISGTVGDANPSSGIASVMLTIDGGTAVAATVNGANWSYNASGLADGNHTINVVATDNAGNASTTTSFTLKVDTVVPTLSVTAPTIVGGVGTVNTSSPTISGTVADASPSSGIASVMLTIDGGAPVAATVNAGVWSYSASGLLDGDHAVSVIATDTAGNASTTTNFTLRVATVAPIVAVTTPTITGGIAYSKTGSPSISGTVTDNSGTGIASVKLTIDGGTPVAATVNGGNWSYSASGLLDGSHTISVVARDNAANTSAATNFTLKVDTVAPTVAVTSPTITGGVAYAKTASPTISGTVGDANPSSGIASVLLTIDGNAPVAATVNAGAWSYSASGLADGNHTISVVATDNAGNNSTAASFTLKVDTVVPTLTIATPTVSGGAATVNTNTPTFSGTVGDASPSSGIASVMLSIDGGPAAAATLNAGNWSYSGATLTNGDHSVSITAADNAGNTTNTSFTLHVVVTHIAPVINLNTAGVTYAKLSPPLLLAPAATLTAGTSTNYAGGSLTVSFSANGTVSDNLLVISNGKISVSGATVNYSGKAIGTISGGTAGSPLVVALTSKATVTATQALVDAVAFQNGSATPSTTPRTVQFVLNDGAGGISTPVTETVSVVVSPVVISPATSTINYTVGDPPATLLGAATFSDSATTKFVGSKLVISSSVPGDQLTIKTNANIKLSNSVISYKGHVIGTIANNTVSFTTGSATQAAIQALLSSFVFSSTGPIGPHTVTFRFTDGFGNTGSAAVTVNVSNNIL